MQGIEDLWKNPMLRKMYSRTQQCLDVPVLLNVLGASGAALIQRQVTREDLIGEFTFEWLASVNNYNMQVRGQQMIGFFQQAKDPAVQQQLAQENARLSLKYLMRSIWSEGLQLPEPERIIEEIRPVRAIQAELENELFETGRADAVKISPADNDIDHLKVHDVLLQPGKLSPERFAYVIHHMEEHLKGMLAKQMMQQQQAMQTAGGRPGLPMIGGPGGPGGSAPGGGGMNPGRPAQTTSPEDLNRSMGRLPGVSGMGPGA